MVSSVDVCGQGQIATAVQQYVINDVYYRVYMLMNNGYMQV